MSQIFSTAVAAQDISTAKLLKTWTATASYDNLKLRVLLSGLAGNGTYQACCTVQPGGAGAIYQTPTSAGYCAATVTTLWLPSIAFPIALGDVLKVYVQGLAGDVSVNGIVALWYGADSPTVADISDGVWDEVLTGATHNVPTSSGRRLRQLAASVIYDGTVAAGSTTNTAVLDAGASAVDGAYDPGMIVIVSGTGEGQTRNVLEYFGATRTAVVDRDWKAVPAAGDTYVILGDAGREHVNEGLAQAGSTASTIVLNALASGQNNAYIGQRVFIRSGTGADQARRVGAYNGTTKVATVTRNWDITPDITSAYVMLPTGAISNPDIAEAVWDAAIASYLDAGSTGLALNTAGAATDPLTNPVPGTYAAGTAGNVIGSINPARITVTSPMAQDGLAVKLVRGDDYLTADGRSLTWTDSGSQWPDLTGATVKFKWGTFTKTCTVIGAGGANQQVSLDLTSAETTVLENGSFDIEAVLLNTHIVTIVVSGSLIIREDV